jgi:hypothetical protein
MRDGRFHRRLSNRDDTADPRNPTIAMERRRTAEVPRMTSLRCRITQMGRET